MKSGFILLAFAACAGADPQAGATPEPKAELFGRVVNANTKQPVRRAAVKIYNSKDQWDEVTDGEGRFKFSPIQRAEYTLIAHREGFSDRFYTVERSDFDQHAELPVELFPQGLITGKVVDAFGQPLQRAGIQAIPSGLRSATGGGASAETNDLGEYRLSGLDPGTYRIRATYREGRESEFDSTPLTKTTSFYRGSEKTAELVVKSGSVTSGIDFVLTPVQAAHIRGTLQAEDGRAVDRATVWLNQAGAGGASGRAEKGKFKIADVSPGTYTVYAQTLGSPTLYGVTTIEMRTGDIDDVEIVLRPSPKIQGRVVLSAGDISTVKIGPIAFLSSEHAQLFGMKFASPDSNGAFDVVLNPGEYTMAFDIPDQFHVEKVTFDDKPVSNWKLSIEPSAESKQLVIVLQRKPKP